MLPPFNAKPRRREDATEQFTELNEEKQVEHFFVSFAQIDLLRSTTAAIEGNGREEPLKTRNTRKRGVNLVLPSAYSAYFAVKSFFAGSRQPTNQLGICFAETTLGGENPIKARTLLRRIKKLRRAGGHKWTR